MDKRIVTNMHLTQQQLRRLIEAEVDTMRTPKGPNSRDDGDNDLQEAIGMNDVDVHGEVVAAGEHLEMAIERMDRALNADEGQLDHIMKSAVKRLRDYLVNNEWVYSLKSNL